MKTKQRNHLTLKHKVAIINECENGVKQSDIAPRYNVSSSCVSGILKNADKIRQQCAAAKSDSVIRYIKNSTLDQCILDWIKSMKENGETVKNSEICKRAVLFNKNLNGDPTFKAGQFLILYYVN